MPEAKFPSEQEQEQAIELAATKASPLFQLMGWSWHEAKHPNYRDIEDHLRRMIESMRKQNLAALEAGRFRIERDQESGDITVMLVLSHAYTT